MEVTLSCNAWNGTKSQDAVMPVSCVNSSCRFCNAWNCGVTTARMFSLAPANGLPPFRP